MLKCAELSKGLSRIGRVFTTSARLRSALVFSGLVSLMATSAMAAPYAAMVMDARNGQIYYAENADMPLHPASLTKMMTLYVVFEAVKRDEISMDSEITVSRNAANEVPSKLGLQAGQKIALRYLVRAAAVKSANDAATAIAEGISGSVEAFASRMNTTAAAIGMSQTHFKNAHGLTEEGHTSSAHDMTLLGRQLLFDYPEYYELFSQLEADAGIATVRHTNSRFLSAYQGADGIKTGYTNASGFSMVGSALRGDERMIATVIGATSSSDRAEKVGDLLNWGFDLAPSQVTIVAPRAPAYRHEFGPEGLFAQQSAPAPVVGAPKSALGFTFQDLANRRSRIIDQTDLETIGVGRKSARSLLSMAISDLSQHTAVSSPKVGDQEGFVAPMGIEMAHAGARYFLRTGIKPGQPKPPRHQMHDVTRIAFGRAANGQIIITDAEDADPALQRLGPADIFNVNYESGASEVAGGGPFTVPLGNPHSSIQATGSAIFNASLYRSLEAQEANIESQTVAEGDQGEPRSLTETMPVTTGQTSQPVAKKLLQ